VFTVVLCVVVVGICVTAVVVEMLSGPDYQPATAGAEPRSPWEPWRSIARRNWARTVTLGRALARAGSRGGRAAASHTGAAASAVARTSRRAGVATAYRTSLAAQASRRAALRGRAATRLAGRRTSALVASATRDGARRGRRLGAATAGHGRRVGRAAGRSTTDLGRRARARARRARIAASSTLASGLGRVEEARTTRSRRRDAARALAGDRHDGASGATPAPDVVHMDAPETTQTTHTWAPAARAPRPPRATASAPTAPTVPTAPASRSSLDVVRPGPARRTLDGPGQRRRQRSPWPSSPAAGRTTRETAAVHSPPSPPRAVLGADLALYEPEVTREAGRRARRAVRRADRRARRVQVVPMPVPTRTRVFAAVKLVFLTTVLGVIAAAVIVALALAVVSALAGI
jgi:hypothetical protein